MPAFARNHERPLTVIDFSRLGLRYFGQFRLDGAALVVHGFQLLGQLAGFVVHIAHEQVERQLRIAHATCGIQARNEREA